MRYTGISKANFTMVFCLVIMFSGCERTTNSKITLVDDFEKDHIADFWLPGDKGSGRFEEVAVSMSNQYHRSGKSSMKLVLKEGYIRQDGGDGNFTERTELDSDTHPFLNHVVWYQFSILVPDDFPIVDNRLIISQIKQTVLFRDPMQLYAQRFRNGNHYLTIYDMASDEKEEAVRIALPELTREKWHDFIFKIHYSDSPDGYLNMWMDGKKVASFTGFTASKNGRNRFYHKIGMYRDQWPDTMTLYFDDYMLTNDTLRINIGVLFN